MIPHWKIFIISLNKMNIIKMKRKIIAVFLLGSMVFSAGVGDIIERNNAAIENERRQQELERRQKELEG